MHFVYVVLGKRLSRKEYLAAQIREEDGFALHPDARLRVEALAAIACESAVDVVVFSGGCTAGDDLPSEAESMLQAFLDADHGPRTPRCLCELGAESTVENAEGAKRLLRNVPCLTIHVITSGYHVERARKIFLAAGCNVVVIAAEEIIGMMVPARKEEMRRYKQSLHVQIEMIKEWCARHFPERFTRKLAAILRK